LCISRPGGANDLKLTPLEIDDDRVSGLEGDVLYALVNIKYQFAVQDWVAVWGSVGLSARLGSEIQSLLAQGVSVNASDLVDPVKYYIRVGTDSNGDSPVPADAVIKYTRYEPTGIVH
jgi:hypothetical protein